MTSPPPPPRLSRRFYLPAVLLAAAGVERIAAGLRGPAWLLGLGVVLLLAGLTLAVVVHRARARG
ncbi:hypothetical protein V3N99_11150 [Dermatophilaceae bacterium Soc4.6]